MLKFENTIMIQRPIHEVFNFLADFTNIPKWNYYVLEVRQISEGPIQEGTAFHQVRKTDEQTFRVIAYQPNQELVVKTIAGDSPQFEIKFDLIKENGSTRLVDEWVLDTGQPAILERLALGKIRSAVADNLAKLKELLETGKTTLQDGRIVRLSP